MKPCERGNAPELLRTHCDSISGDYIARRLENPAYRFQWPQRNGQSLYEVVRLALAVMTDGRCAYCDGYPIGAMGEEQIDHFRPKSRQEFYHLVCEWTNLFLICSACNKAKLQQWDDMLLRPDHPHFAFDRYFIYLTDSGMIGPNPAALPDEQESATRTIRLFSLNRPDACILRRQMVRMILNTTAEEDLLDIGYRYLIDIVR